MAAYLIGHIEVLDFAKWTEYLGKVDQTILAYGGEVIFRGLKHATVSSGEGFTSGREYARVVALKFADMAVLHRWHDSAEYAALKPLRHGAAAVTVITYEDDDESLRITANTRK
jgi:uncharacterized protein (DUF1330 family)